MSRKYNIVAKSFALLFVAVSSIGACTKKEEVKLSPAAEKNLVDADAYVAKNKTAPGIVTTNSGLQYQIISSGPVDGKKPDFNSIVRVNYEGKLADGTVFDSSYERGAAVEFPVADLIPAWTEALQLMRPGDEWTIWVHPRIGYGPIAMPQGCGEIMPCAIPPNSLLIFRMRLEGIVGGDSVNDILPEDKVGGEEHGSNIPTNQTVETGNMTNTINEPKQ